MIVELSPQELGKLNLNCYGCHNIEGNAPQIWKYFDVFNPDGSFNYENLNNAPPRSLI